MTFPQVQFVASPDEGADVRFDFNTAGEWANDETWPEHDGYTLGAPSLDGDPDGVNTQYGFRDLAFNLILRGTNASVTAQVSALARELRRQNNWLRFQLSAMSEPVWFKTYRSTPGALDFQLVQSVDDSSRNYWRLGVSLDADSFAVGAQVTALTSAVVTNNPLAATNPCSVVLPEIRGDAPTPLVVKLFVPTPSVTEHQFFLACGHGDRQEAAPVTWQASSFSAALFADTDASETSDAAYVGGSYRRITFATDASMIGRLAATAPSTVAPGLYKAFVRVARSDSTSTFALQMEFDSNHPVTGPVATFAPGSSSGFATWVDVGEFSLPVETNGLPPSTGEVNGTAPYVVFKAQRLSGTGHLRIDCLTLIPMHLMDEEPASGMFFDLSLPSDWGITPMQIDGPTEAIITPYLGALYPPLARFAGGGFPTAVPGTTNMLYLLMQTTTTRATPVNPDSITRTIPVSVSYRPRWLYLAGA